MTKTITSDAVITVNDNEYIVTRGQRVTLGESRQRHFCFDVRVRETDEFGQSYTMTCNPIYAAAATVDAVRAALEKRYG